MFYSHNLLARKGPLGTVWCAAHLQNKLRKSNYITINIPFTVEQIMNPQVPIALRMSGHLLLGIVRIYSKKVEYLQHDYNVLRIDISKAYAYADINLPEDANQAKFESITIPDSCALDLLDIDEYNPDRLPDMHLRRHEEITLMDHSPVSLLKHTDQVPAGYIAISLSEDRSATPSSVRRSMPMEENSHSINPPEIMRGVQDLSPNQHLGPPEILREPVFDDNLRMAPIGSPIISDIVEPDQVLVEQLTNEKFNGFEGSEQPPEILREPVFEGNLRMASIGSPIIPDMVEQLTNERSNGLVDEMEVDVENLLLSKQTPQYDIAPTPLIDPAPAAEQPRPRRRRPKRIRYDEATVLTNDFMKKSLDDHSDLLRKRKRKEDRSSLDEWKLNNTNKKEKVLFDPIITGFCDNLRHILEDDYVSTKAHLIDIEEAHSVDLEVEHLRDIVTPSDHNVVPTYSSDHASFRSPLQMGETTPPVSTGIGSKSNQVQTTTGTSSIGSDFSEETHTPFSQGHQGFHNNGALYDIPEGDDAEEELAFIEKDDGTPTNDTPDVIFSPGKQRSPPGIDSLLPRTRAVAQYIKEKSSASPSTPKGVRSVRLNNILEGKTRKVSSRMFFETLVLKSCDLVDVKQYEPYGDITLNVTCKLSEHHFSS